MEVVLSGDCRWNLPSRSEDCLVGCPLTPAQRAFGQERGIRGAVEPHQEIFHYAVLPRPSLYPLIRPWPSGITEFLKMPRVCIVGCYGTKQFWKGWVWEFSLACKCRMLVRKTVTPISGTKEGLGQCPWPGDSAAPSVKWVQPKSGFSLWVC